MPLTSSSGALRRRLHRTPGAVVCAAVLTIGALGFAFVGVQAERGQVAVIVIAALLGISSWRLWIAGIRISSDGVKLNAILFSKRFQWSEIDHFAVLPMARAECVAHVVLRDGRTVGCAALGSAGAPVPERTRLRIQAAVDDLNQALDDWRRTASAKPDDETQAR